VKKADDRQQHLYIPFAKYSESQGKYKFRDGALQNELLQRS
jgi:hypothetical protein